MEAVMRVEDVPAILGHAVGERGLVTEESDLEPYCHDWLHMFNGRPLCVVLPQNTREVAEVVRLRAAAGIALVPHGGNTGLSGGATPDDSGHQWSAQPAQRQRRL